MNNDDLIESARALAAKGVQKNDGFDYSIPAAELNKYQESLRGLADALEKAEAELRTNYASVASTALHMLAGAVPVDLWVTYGGLTREQALHIQAWIEEKAQRTAGELS